MLYPFRCREIALKDTALTLEAMLSQFSVGWGASISIRSSIDIDRQSLFSQWWLFGPVEPHKRTRSKTISPISIRFLPQAQEERDFSRLHLCDIRTGLATVNGNQEDDMRALASALGTAMRVTADERHKVKYIARKLRVRSPAALAILAHRPSGPALVQAALPHLAAQANACFRWATLQADTLNLDMTGESILDRLGLAPL